MAYVTIIDKPEAKKFRRKCTTIPQPDYDYRPAREVAEGDENTEVRSVIDVDILGHIFEQSISDLERLRLSLEAGTVGARTFLSASGDLPRSADKNVRAPQEKELPTTRRKLEGAVYTSAFITRYIVGQALGGVLKGRFETLRQQHEAQVADG